MPPAPLMVSLYRRSLLPVALLLCTGAAPAQDGDRQAATERLAEVEREIATLQAELGEARGKLSRERQALRDLDLDIQDNARALATVERDLDAQRAEVEKLRRARDDYLDQLRARRDELSRQVLAAWELSRESRLKLILNQDDPARLGRLLAYYDIVGEAQAGRIAELRAALVDLEEMQRGLDAELATLEALKARQARRGATLDAGREERLALVAAIEGALSDGERRLEELTRNRRDLEAILERLEDALADIPADLGSRQHPSSQRGALPMPVDGRVLEAYGRPRAAGLAWQGWLIAAPAGAEVRAVAYGRVAYADWLRGYGLLLIIDHGDGFMSLYGHNESLRAEVGDWVDAGDAVSTVGQGPERRTGLYFELRRDGKAIDPAAWVRR